MVVEEIQFGSKVVDDKEIKYVFGTGTVIITTITLYAISLRYNTSRPNEWLVRTGLGINNMEISKKFIKWPFQNIDRIDLAPSSFKFSVNAMSKEKMEFNFPAIFTIGPRNQQEALEKYSIFLMAQNKEQVDSLIRGIIEGETRTLAANLSIEDIFTARNEFKNDIVNGIQKQLDHYGLEIYNANVEELRDSDTSNYFKSLSQKIKADAENRAKVEVSESDKKGIIGAKERDAETRQKLAEYETQTQIVENTKQQEIIKSKAELEKTIAEQNFVIQQAKIKAEQEAEVIRIQLQKEVEIKRQEMELEKQRAVELTSSTVIAETLIKEAEGRAQSKKIAADAHLYSKQKEAEGILAMYQAQSEGLQKLVNSFNGDSRALLSYTMLEKGVYEKLAESNAKAIKDLNPKITVWTSDPNNSMDVIQNLGKSIIPMLDTIKDQTGYSMPDWMIKKGGDNEIKK